MAFKKSALVPFLFLLLFTVIILDYNQKTPITPQKNCSKNDQTNLIPDPNSPLSAISYTNFSPITINGDADFANKTNTNYWLGNGTATNPYIINKLNITSSLANITLISIANTMVTFSIQNDWLGGGMIGIFLQNATNGYIENNLIQSCIGYGIELFQSPQNALINNTITNIVGSGVHSGIYCSQSDQTLLENNTCSFNSIGIWLDQSTNCSVIANWVNYNGIYGIYTAYQGEILILEIRLMMIS